MISRLLIIILLASISLYAKVIKEDILPAFLKKNIKIFDIRRVDEWKKSGIIKNSITLQFFDKYRKYSLKKFVANLKSKLSKKGEEFAVICASGRRSAIVSEFLSNEGFNVIDLIGGITEAKKRGIGLIPYKKN